MIARRPRTQTPFTHVNNYAISKPQNVETKGRKKKYTR